MKTKIINIVITILAILSSISIIVFAMKYNQTEPDKSEFFQSFSLYVTYILMIAAVIIMLGFVIYQLAKNFKQSKLGLIGVGIIIGLFVVSYLLSSPQNSLIEQKFAVSDQLSKTIGASLIATYIMLFAVIASIVWITVSSRFKN